MYYFAAIFFSFYCKLYFLSANVAIKILFSIAGDGKS